MTTSGLRGKYKSAGKGRGSPRGCSNLPVAGTRFGDVLTTGRTWGRGYTARIECRCTLCGRLKRVPFHRLRRPTFKSCGCRRFSNLKRNERIGMLRIDGKAPSKVAGDVLYRCHCVICKKSYVKKARALNQMRVHGTGKCSCTILHVYERRKKRYKRGVVVPGTLLKVVGPSSPTYRRIRVRCTGGTTYCQSRGVFELKADILDSATTTSCGCLKAKAGGISLFGMSMSYQEAGRLAGVSGKLIWKRVKRGLSLEEAVLLPVKR